MDSVLGIVQLVAYIAAILALSMAMTWLVVKISPSQAVKEQQTSEPEGS